MQERVDNAQDMTNFYYDLATDFYEYGWCAVVLAVAPASRRWPCSPIALSLSLPLSLPLPLPSHRGQSFHFAPRYKVESFHESILRHEHYLAAHLEVKAGEKVLDVGCGVGGPLRNIARFTGANVTGINNNAYQLRRLAAKVRSEGLDGRCEGVKGDFMNLPFPANSFDGAYAIEATCHAPDRTGCFAQIFKVLKPGKIFAG